ncbi:MAG: YgiT-type zinc finger protein [Chloroflexota bacterium]|nr:YgiT-type zinc finger protein [Chloroflexota bacterium]
MNRPMNEHLWHQLTADVMTGMREWRLQHPKATLREMETELDARLGHMRARMLEDMALASAAADWTAISRDQQPTCPECGTVLQERGQHSRTLQTHGGQELTLDRSYGVCPACGTGVFPPR